ncbi:zinc-binding dehydrogenase, partial [Amycolatopsis plumensis]|uniref:zinc-binding dehydrogenase n=1 Tax=Amycolatopsis plumensis TaxID=236508 RepID=UPI0036192E20
AGAHVIATTSSTAKAERLKALGVDEVINYRQKPDWWEDVRTLTDGAGVDLVVDAAGPLEQSLKSVASGGDVALVGYWLSGLDGAKPVDPALIFAAGATLHRTAAGSRLSLRRSEPLDHHAQDAPRN